MPRDSCAAKRLRHEHGKGERSRTSQRLRLPIRCTPHRMWLCCAQRMRKAAALRSAQAIALVLLCTASSLAEPPRRAVVWYRSAERCPTGDEFVSLLGELGGLVRLARPGDHIDFVVTLTSTDEVSHGQLERQTQAGTVAMRELEDSSCDRVAEAIALSLGLALAPPRQAAPFSAAGTASASEPPTTEQEPADAPLASPVRIPGPLGQ